MRDLQEIINKGSYQQLLDTTATWSDKQKREAAKWLAVYGKERRGGLDALYEQDGGAVWMCLVIAQVVTATDVKKAFAIDPPISRYRSATWDSEQALLPVSAAAKVALVQAICRQGRAWAESYVALAAGGKRKKPAYADVLLAVMRIHDLPPAQDAYLAELWATASNRGIPYEAARDPAASDARFQMPVAQLTVAQDALGNWHVTGQDIVASSPAEFLQHQFMLKPMLHQLLAQPDSILRLIGGYAAAYSMDQLAEAVATLVAGGSLDSETLTGDAIAALTRGDSVTAQRMQVRVLLAAGPTPAVIAPHAQTLCNLLASGHGGAAEAAQSLLAQLDSAHGLDGDLFQNACQVVFARKEKGLRRDQLAWATRRLKERPAETAVTVQGLIEALQVDDYAMQKDAVEKITKAWPQVEAHQQAALLAVVDGSRGALDSKLHVQLMAALGAAQEPVQISAPVDAGLAPRVWTPPARTPQALVPFARLVGIAEDPAPYLAALSAFNTTPSVNAIEQLLDLAVRSSNAGNASLANKLLSYFRSTDPTAYQRLLVEHGRNRAPQHPNARFHNVTLPMVASVARMRLSEAVQAIAAGAPYLLLSTPSYTNGALEPDALHAGLLRAAEMNQAASPMDLLLALMRTRPASAEQVSKLRSVGTVQATIAADFLAAGGMAQMRTELAITEPQPEKRYNATDTDWVNRDNPEVCVTLHAMPVLPDIDPIPVRWSEGFTPYTAPDIWEFDIEEQYLGGVMPNSGELLAAIYLWGFRKAGLEYNTEGGKNTVMRLPLFLAPGGPAGPALHLAVLYSLSANAPEARIVGSDGLLTLLAQGRYDEALGTQLVALCMQHGTLKAGRLAASLGRVADGGEEAAVWALLRAALVAALGKSVPPPGTADLMAQASRVAPVLGVKEDIPVLAALAKTKGSSKLLVEARRLHGELTHT